jgi:Ni/Co efflux regulator RcnB
VLNPKVVRGAANISRQQPEEEPLQDIIEYIRHEEYMVTGARALKSFCKLLKEDGRDIHNPLTAQDLEKGNKGTNIYMDMAWFNYLTATTAPIVINPLLLDGWVHATRGLWHLAMVWNYGGQTFKISEGLAWKLVLTDIKHLEWGDIRLPYPAFVLQIPRGLFYVSHKATGRHEVDTILVVKYINPEGKDSLSLDVFGAENEKSSMPLDDCFHFFPISHPEDGKLSTAFRFVEDQANRYSDNLQSTTSTGKTVQKEIFRFVINVLMYVNSTKDVQRLPSLARDKLQVRLSKASGKRAERLRKELADLPRIAEFDVGKAVRIDKNLAAVASDLSHGTRISFQRRASYVRGHYQRYGLPDPEGNKMWVWKEPYWRDLVDGKPEGIRPYTVT